MSSATRGPAPRDAAGSPPLPEAVGARAALVLACGLALWALARLGDRAFAMLGSPWGRDYGEGHILAMLQLLAERGSYFTPLDELPMIQGIYPPGFLLLTLPFHLWLGPSLMVTRLVSLVFAVGMIVMLHRILRARTEGGVYAAAFALLPATPWFVQTWVPLGRVDTMATFLSLAGLLLWDRYGDRPGPSRFLAFPVFWMAFFTKQNAVLAPAAVILFLLLSAERRREAARAVVVWALPIAALTGILTLATSGEAWRHLVTHTAAAGWEWERMARSVRDFALLAGPLLAIALPAVIAFPRRFLFGGGEGLFGLYFVLNLGALVTIGKEGAAQNYLIEPFVATVLMAGLALFRLGAAHPALRPTWPVVLLVATAVSFFAGYDRGRRREAVATAAEVAEFRELDQAVRLAEGAVLSDNMSLLVLNGRPVLLAPFEVEMLARRGRVDVSRLVGECEAKRFALVITEGVLDRIPGMGDCLRERYAEWKRLDRYVLLRPNGS